MIRACLCECIQAASTLCTRDFWLIVCWNIEQLTATMVRASFCLGGGTKDDYIAKMILETKIDRQNGPGGLSSPSSMQSAKVNHVRII